MATQATTDLRIVYSAMFMRGPGAPAGLERADRHAFAQRADARSDDALAGREPGLRRCRRRRWRRYALAAARDPPAVADDPHARPALRVGGPRRRGRDGDGGVRRRRPPASAAGSRLTAIPGSRLTPAGSRAHREHHRMGLRQRVGLGGEGLRLEPRAPAPWRGAVALHAALALENATAAPLRPHAAHQTLGHIHHDLERAQVLQLGDRLFSLHIGEGLDAAAGDHALERRLDRSVGEIALGGGEAGAARLRGGRGGRRPRRGRPPARSHRR